MRSVATYAAVLALMIWGAAASALALEANQVRGRITDVNLSENRLQLEVSEAGEERTLAAVRTPTKQTGADRVDPAPGGLHLVAALTTARPTRPMIA